MITLYTQSAAHLAQDITLPRMEYTRTQFSDGELYIKVDPINTDQKIWIITGTQAPAQNLIELFLLLDALAHAGAKKINIFFTYFGYARQAIAFSGEASSAQLLCSIIKTFPLNKTVIMHAHAAQQLHTMLNFTNALDFNFFCNAAASYDIVAAPDEGAAPFAQEVARTCNKEIIFLHKTRPQHERVHIESIDGTVQGKKILLIDDMITTGRTLLEAALALKKMGAVAISAAATHGIFSNGAYERLATSPIQKVYTTNTLAQTTNSISTIYNIGPFIQKFIELKSGRE